MNTILEFAQQVLSDTGPKIGHSTRDCDVLKKAAPLVASWSKDFGRIYAATVFTGVEASDYFSIDDRQQAFAVWYENLVSGAASPSFWAETSLIGLDHAVVGIHNRHVVAMSACLRQEFLRRIVKAVEPPRALEIYEAFTRILDVAVGIMVDTYYNAVMSGMADIGMNERLVKRVRNTSLRKMIDKSRESLPVVEWNDSLSVGIQSIDEQHKHLVGLLNTLKDSRVSGKGNETLAKILGELAQYTVHHFGTEEKHMQAHAYPDFANHKKAHETLVAQVTKFAEEFAAGRAQMGGELFAFLRNWLNGHIRGTDKLYGPFLSQRGVI